MKVEVKLKDGEILFLTLRTQDFYNYIENKNDTRARYMIFEEGAINQNDIKKIFPIEPNKALENYHLEE